MVDLDSVFDVIAEDLSPAESARLRRMMKNKIVRFKYVKKDGSDREARGTLRPDMLPRYSQRRRAKPSRTLFRYWDVDKGQFRSFVKARFQELIGPEDEDGNENREEKAGEG